MNKSRRESLSTISEELESIKSRLEDVSDEEREAYDNLPENLQYSSRGESMQYGLDELIEAAENLDSTIEHINNVIEE